MTETTIRLPVELERFLSAQVKQGLHRSREAAILAVVERGLLRARSSRAGNATRPGPLTAGAH